MIDRLRLRSNIVLVLLPPAAALQQTAGGIITAPATTPTPTYGRVLRTGPRALDVQRGDLVAFSPTAGEPCDYGNHSLLFLREPEIDFIVEKEPAA